MPSMMTVVTFTDADGAEFPITLIGRYQTVEDAIAEANGILTKAIWEGDLSPKKPLTVSGVPYEWGGTIQR